MLKNFHVITREVATRFLQKYSLVLFDRALYYNNISNGTFSEAVLYSRGNNFIAYYLLHITTGHNHQGSPSYIGAEKRVDTVYQYIIIILFTIEKLVELMKINDNCVGCGQCASFCKKGAIEVRGRAWATDACVECGMCIPYCPVKAIEVPA